VIRCLSIDASGGLLFCDPGRGSLETNLLPDINGQCIAEERIFSIQSWFMILGSQELFHTQK
jgi:hypothetical protein